MKDLSDIDIHSPEFSDYFRFITFIIEEGIKAATRDYKGKGDKLLGSIAGFNACRDMTPYELRTLLQKSRQKTDDLRQRKDGITKFWYYRCYEVEVEWVCNCVSIYLNPRGYETIVPMTARAGLTVNAFFNIEK